jgi:hypothetical protein
MRMLSTTLILKGSMIVFMCAPIAWEIRLAGIHADRKGAPGILTGAFYQGFEKL